MRTGPGRHTFKQKSCIRNETLTNFHVFLRISCEPLSQRRFLSPWKIIGDLRCGIVNFDNYG